MTKDVSLRLEGSWNSRDVGTLTDAKKGILLRSANLANLSKEGQEKLLELGVTDVIDLRTHAEIESYGIDKLPASINLHMVPIDAGDVSKFKDAFGDSVAESLKTLMADPHAEKIGATYMTQMYRQLVGQETSAKQLVDAMKIIAAAQGATLIHCTAGKDRTGVLSALVLSVVGVLNNSIEEDYLYSNNSVETLQAHIGSHEIPPQFSQVMFGVNPQYLRAAQAEIKEHYGNIDEFLKKNDFSDDNLAQLRNKFATNL